MQGEGEMEYADYREAESEAQAAHDAQMSAEAEACEAEAESEAQAAHDAQMSAEAENEAIRDKEKFENEKIKE